MILVKQGHETITYSVRAADITILREPPDPLHGTRRPRRAVLV